MAQSFVTVIATLTNNIYSSDFENVNCPQNCVHMGFSPWNLTLVVVRYTKQPSKLFLKK